MKKFALGMASALLAVVGALGCLAVADEVASGAEKDAAAATPYASLGWD